MHHDIRIRRAGKSLWQRGEQRGDVDNDGFEDFIIGAWGDNLHGDGAGAALVYSGKAPTRFLAAFYGNSASDNFGWAVSGAGDVNNDGFDDVVVGARFDNDGGLNAGSARVYSGEWIERTSQGQSAQTAQVLHTFLGNAGDYLGWSVSDVGDVDLDGYDDILVGAPESSGNGNSNHGRTQLYSGRTGVVLFTWDGIQPGTRSGRAVSGAGDVNGDGYPDVIIGAPFEDFGGIDRGSVRVFSGEWIAKTFAGQTPNTNPCLICQFGGSTAELFGRAVSAAGDVNGDGFDDIIVGSGFADTNGTNSGTMKVLSGPNGSPLFAFEGSSAGDEFGYAVCGAGDVNNDGFADLLVGAIGDANNGQRSGSVRVFPGLPAGCSNTTSSADCNNNGLPDQCDVIRRTFTSSSPTLTPFDVFSPQTFTVVSPPQAESDVTLSISTRSDFDHNTEFATVFVNGVSVGCVFKIGASLCASPTSPDTEDLVIPSSVFNAAVGGGDAVINLVTQPGVAGCTSSFVQLRVEYDPIDSDCNGNGVPDSCEPPLGPSINRQPVSQIACEGLPTCLSVGAPGAPEYQWYRRTPGQGQFFPIPSGTDADLDFLEVQLNDAGDYYVIVFNSCGEVQSREVFLAVDPSPFSLPVGATVCEDLSFVLTVNAPGAIPNQYQWYEETEGLLLAGQTTETLTIENVDPTIHDGNMYYAEITYACRIRETTRTTLRVDPKPAISTFELILFEAPPVCEEDRVEFEVTASNSSSYRWFHDGTELVGESDRTLSILSVSEDDAGVYRVEALNRCGFDSSDSIVLVVETDPLVSHWTGAVDDLFRNVENWDTCVVSTVETVLENAGVVDNVSVIDAGASVQLELLSASATGLGRQILRIEGGGMLNASTGATVGAGGEMQLEGGEFTGNLSIDEQARLCGEGSVVASVSNRGRIEANVSLRTLAIDGQISSFPMSVLAANNQSTLSIISPNQTIEAVVEITDGSRVVYEGLVTNNGRIEIDQSELRGGVEFTNNGEILMSGSPSVVRTSGLILNNSEVCVVSGAGQFFGSAFQHSAGARLNIASGAFAFFNGGLLLPGGAVSWNASCSFSVRGAQTPAEVTVLGNVEAGTASSLFMDSGLLRVSGNLEVAIDDPNRFDGSSGTVEMIGLGAGSIQEIEVMAPDWGREAVPGQSLFAIGTLRIGPGDHTVVLVDNHDNGGRGETGEEVLYVEHLVLDPNVTLDLGGCKLYYRDVVPANPCSDPSITILGQDCLNQLVATLDIILVDDDASGAADGSSWENAFTRLQDALAAVQPGNQIWVAEGTYHPDRGPSQSLGDRLATFQLRNGVAIYGGFSGHESVLGERAGLYDQTILSGDLADNDETMGDISENSYHVVTGTERDETAILDGFTISGGNADSNFPEDRGGGVLNYPGSPTISNCTFDGNRAAQFGGGLGNFIASAPRILDCTFRENFAGSEGGGVYNQNSSPRLTDCLFVDNEAGYGAGMTNSNSSSGEILNCWFVGNAAEIHGGGMYNFSRSAPTVNDCTFQANTAILGGGMYIRTNSSPVLKGCIFRQNAASNAGGGLGNQSNCNPQLVNCSFIENEVTGSGGAIHNNTACSPVLTGCRFDGNRSTGSGGGIYTTFGGSPIIVDCIFFGNHATGSTSTGGALFNGRDTDPRMINCRFIDNSSVSSNGGGVYCTLSTPTLVNCLFQGNSAGIRGGAFYSHDGESYLVNNTFWRNSANSDGGAVYSALGFGHFGDH